MASKPDPHNTTRTQDKTENPFQNWVVAEEEPPGIYDWKVANTDDRNPIYNLYPNPSKATIAQIAADLRYSSSPDVIINGQTVSRDLAVEWLISVASARNPLIQRAITDNELDELQLLELIEEVNIRTQMESAPPDTKEQLVQNYKAELNKQAQLAKDTSGRPRIPSSKELMALAQRNALSAYYKTNHVDPVAQAVFQTAQRSTQPSKQLPDFLKILKTDADIVAKTAAMLANSLSTAELNANLGEAVIDAIIRESLQNTSLEQNHNVKIQLRDSIRVELDQRRQQVRDIGTANQKLVDQLVTEEHISRGDAEKVVPRFQEIANATTSSTNAPLTPAQTSQIIAVAIADVQSGQSSVPATTRAWSILESSGTRATTPPIPVSPETKLALNQLLEAQQSPTANAIHALETTLIAENRLDRARATQVVERFTQLLEAAPLTTVTDGHERLLTAAMADVMSGQTTIPTTSRVQTIIDAPLGAITAPPPIQITSETTSVLAQLVDAHTKAGSKQINIGIEASQSLATHLVSDGVVGVREAPEVVKHFDQLVRDATQLNGKPLTEMQVQQLMDVAVQHTTKGQQGITATQRSSDIAAVITPTSPKPADTPATTPSPKTQDAATKAIQTHDKAQQSASYVISEAAFSDHAIAQFYKNYGVDDIQAIHNISKVKQLIGQGYTVQDALLQAGGKDFEQKVQDSLNTQEDVNRFIQEMDSLKSHVKTPQASVFLGDHELVIDHFKIKGTNQTISFNEALNDINQIRRASGLTIITDKQLKLALLHPDTFQELIKNNPHLAATLGGIAADSAQIREFLQTNKEILGIKNGQLVLIVAEDNLIRLNPERGFGVFASKMSGNFPNFRQEARSIVEALKMRIAGKGVDATSEKRSFGKRGIRTHLVTRDGRKATGDQASVAIEAHWENHQGNRLQFGFRRFTQPFRNLFQRARATFSRTIGRWSNMGGIRGFIGTTISRGLARFGVRGISNNFIANARSAVAKKVASKLGGKALEQGLTKLVGLIGPWGKVASIVLSVIGLDNLKKIIGGLATLMFVAPLLWAAGLASKIAGVVSKGTTAAAKGSQAILSSGTSAGGLSPLIANAPIIAVAASAVAGIFTITQLTAVFMLPPYEKLSNFFDNQGDPTSYSCPDANIPSSFPTGSPVEGSGWPITTGINQNTGRSQHHNAIDIAVPTGTKVISTVTGYVLFAGWNNDGYGNLVILRSADNAFTVYYAHLTKVIVKVNDPVIKNQTLIGLSGDTGNSSGPHLHYELRSPLYSNISIACGLGLSPEAVEKINNGCPGGCGKMP